MSFFFKDGLVLVQVIIVISVFLIVIAVIAYGLIRILDSLMGKVIDLWRRVTARKGHHMCITCKHVFLGQFGDAGSMFSYTCTCKDNAGIVDNYVIGSFIDSRTAYCATRNFNGLCPFYTENNRP